MSLSCECDFDGEGQEYWEHYPVARKQHVCCECAGTIEPGDEYELVTLLYDGMFNTFKTCERCADVRESIVALGYCHPPYGYLREQYLEYLEIERQAHPNLPMPRNHLTREWYEHE